MFLPFHVPQVPPTKDNNNNKKRIVRLAESQLLVVTGLIKKGNAERGREGAPVTVIAYTVCPNS